MPEPTPLPDAIAAWMPKHALDAFQGVWIFNQEAWEITGTQMHVWDGGWMNSQQLSIDTPCRVSFGGRGAAFLIRDGAPWVDASPAGMRKGKSAIVCAGMEDTFLITEQGCAVWRRDWRSKTWSSRPHPCTWTDVDGTDALMLRSDLVLVADGDFLVSRDFAKRPLKRAAGFEEAKVRATKLRKEREAAQAK